MKKSAVGIFVIALLFGCSGSLWADAQNFPVDFAASFVGESTNTLIKVEANEMRVSVNSSEGEPIQDYLMDVEQGTIAQSSGEMVTRGGEGYAEVYNAVLASLNSAKDGLASTGDAVNAESLGTTVSYLQNFA